MASDPYAGMTEAGNGPMVGVDQAYQNYLGHEDPANDWLTHLPPDLQQQAVMEHAARWGGGGGGFDSGMAVPWQGAGFGLGAPPADPRYAPLPPAFARQGALFDRYFTQTGALPPLDTSGRTPAEQMLRQMGPGRTPTPPPSVSVPGGASIINGQPMAAAPPPPFTPPGQGTTGSYQFPGKAGRLASKARSRYGG